jgi:hypothetical protein
MANPLACLRWVRRLIDSTTNMFLPKHNVFGGFLAQNKLSISDEILSINAVSAKPR